MSGDDEPINLPEDYMRQEPPPPPPPGYGPEGQPGHPPYAPAPYGYGQPAQPQWPGQWQAAPPKHSQATTALVLGIVGLAGSPFSCGLSLLVSPIAWVIGGRTVREIKASPGQWSGESDANTGRITGLIGTVLLALAVLLFIGFVALMFVATPDGSSGDIVYERSSVPGSTDM